MCDLHLDINRNDIVDSLNNNYGLITENNEDALYSGIKKILDNPDTLARYKEKAKERGIIFSTEHTVRKVENMLLGL